MFLQNGDLDTEGHFPLIFKQEKERIGEEEIIKLLKDFRNIPRLRIQVIPGSLSITLSTLTPEESGVFTTGLVPLIPMMPTYNQAPFIREVQEFPTHSDMLLSPTKLQPFQEFFHILYVYPQSLKLEAAGYSWLPILQPHNDTLLMKDTFSLGISTTLPPNYLSHGLGVRGGDIKWIDNRKHLPSLVTTCQFYITTGYVCVQFLQLPREDTETEWRLRRVRYQTATRRHAQCDSIQPDITPVYHTEPAAEAIHATYSEQRDRSDATVPTS